jgi:hypothetical protein
MDVLKKDLDLDVQFKREYSGTVDEQTISFLLENVCQFSASTFDVSVSKQKKEKEVPRTKVVMDGKEFSIADIHQSEILFNPNMVTGLREPGLGEYVLDSMLKCDLDKRTSLLENLMLVGPGCQKLKGSYKSR